MKIAIHQPNYLPYLGFFDKMSKADVFVIYDDAQFSKEDFHHRNKIRIFHGWKWLTLPVEKRLAPIHDILIKKEFFVKNKKWYDVHLFDIKENYKKSPHFLTYEPAIESIYQSEYEYLIDINMELINFLMKSFEINTKIIFSSELGFKSRSTEKLVDIVESLGGDTYLSGQGGKNYLDASLFDMRGISIEYQEFNHPHYKQCFENFEPNMASIDALFNIGKKTFVKGNLNA